MDYVKKINPKYKMATTKCVKQKQTKLKEA